MNKLLEFIDRLCLDEKLYWRMPMLAKSGTCEVQWRRDAKPSAWSIRPVGTEEWAHFSKGEMPRALERYSLDPIAFDRQVGATILTQAVFADMVMEGAIELFGQEAVRKSIADTRSFLSGVSDAAKRMTNTTAGKTMPVRQPPTAQAPAKQPASAKPTQVAGKPSLRLVAISWFLLGFAVLSAPRAQADAAGKTGHAVDSVLEVDDVACASFAQILLPSQTSAYLPFVGAGLAFHADRAASFATQVLETETFRFAIAIGLVKNL